VFDADCVLLPVSQMGHLHDGNTVMLVIEREKRDEVISVANLGIQHQLPPRDHLVVVACSKHDVRQLHWRGGCIRRQKDLR